MALLYVLVIVNLLVLLVVFINQAGWRPLAPQPEHSSPCISILIPARNEEQHIAQAIRSALAQGSAVQEILVYNDHSEDRTEELILAMQAESDKVRLIGPRPLPVDWHGKPFACAQLADAAAGQWLLFLDADTKLHKGAAEAMLQAVDVHNVTFLSCWPAILSASFWEHVFMPMLNFVVYSIFPTPMQHKDASPSFGLAHGACLFMERHTYEKIGGHRAVKQELFEDTVLARVWREKGHMGICLNGQRIVSVRMYHSLREIIRGFSKIVYPAFRKERSFWMFMTFHGCFMLLPFLLLCAIPFGLPALLPALAASAVLAARLLQCRQFGYPLWSAFFHPLATLGMIGLGLVIRHQCRHHNGVTWKGRAYNPVQSL